MNKLNILISKAKEYKGVFTTKISVGQTYFDAGEKES